MYVYICARCHSSFEWWFIEVFQDTTTTSASSTSWPNVSTFPQLVSPNGIRALPTNRQWLLNVHMYSLEFTQFEFNLSYVVWLPFTIVIFSLVSLSFLFVCFVRWFIVMFQCFTCMHLTFLECAASETERNGM